jgi:predicted ATP-grasp superfamily ATP-dependent carboligase
MTTIVDVTRTAASDHQNILLKFASNTDLEHFYCFFRMFKAAGGSKEEPNIYWVNSLGIDDSLKRIKFEMMLDDKVVRTMMIFFNTNKDKEISEIGAIHHRRTDFGIEFRFVMSHQSFQSFNPFQHYRLE